MNSYTVNSSSATHIVLKILAPCHHESEMRFLRKGQFQAVWLILGMWEGALGLSCPWQFRICVIAGINSEQCGGGSGN